MSVETEQTGQLNQAAAAELRARQAEAEQSALKEIADNLAVVQATLEEAAAAIAAWKKKSLAELAPLAARLGELLAARTRCHAARAELIRATSPDPLGVSQRRLEELNTRLAAARDELASAQRRRPGGARVDIVRDATRWSAEHEYQQARVKYHELSREFTLASRETVAIGSRA